MSKKHHKNYGPLKIYSVPLCHGLPDRSIYFRNKPLPLCARCTGTLLGVFTLPIFHWGILDPSIELIFILGAPALFDALTQFLGLRKSNNKMRLLTGFLLGMGIGALIILCGQFLVSLIVLKL